MDEIEQRLRTATENCINSYDAWSKNQKDGEVREKLMEAVHELRKVAARLENGIAISKRDEMAARPIPIPPHRASRKQQGDMGIDDSVGNVLDNGNDMQPRSHGGGGGGGQHRHGGRRGGGGGRPHGGGHGGGGNNRPNDQ